MVFSMQFSFMEMSWEMRCSMEAGPGKLPTASAVVSDVVEAAKNLNRNVMTMWKEEKLRLGR